MLTEKLRDIPAEMRNWSRNAQVLVAAEIFWAIPATWIFFYQTIFMKELGINEIYIGFLLTLPLIFQIFFPMIGGYFADRFGRKTTLMFFDVIGWIGYPATLFISTQFWQILVAMSFFGISSAVFGVWQAYIIEDTKPRHRIRVFSSIQTISIVAGLLTPVGGAMISIYGILQGSRYIFLASIISNTIMFIFRQILLRESEVGRILTSQESNSQHSRSYIETLKVSLKNRDLLLLLSLTIIGSTSDKLMMSFRPLYLTDQRAIGLEKSIASIVPTASSISTLVVLTFIIPLLVNRHIVKALLSSYVIGFIGLLVLMNTPTGSMHLAILSGALDGARYLAIYSILPVFLVNTIDDIDPFMKVKIISLSITLSAMFVWPIPALGGYLYSIDPRYPFVLAASVLMIGISLLVYHILRKSRSIKN